MFVLANLVTAPLSARINAALGFTERMSCCMYFNRGCFCSAVKLVNTTLFTTPVIDTQNKQTLLHQANKDMHTWAPTLTYKYLGKQKNYPMGLTMTTLLQEFREEKPGEIKHFNNACVLYESHISKFFLNNIAFGLRNSPECKRSTDVFFLSLCGVYVGVMAVLLQIYVTTGNVWWKNVTCVPWRTLEGWHRLWQHPKWPCFEPVGLDDIW